MTENDSIEGGSMKSYEENNSNGSVMTQKEFEVLKRQKEEDFSVYRLQCEQEIRRLEVVHELDLQAIPNKHKSSLSKLQDQKRLVNEENQTIELLCREQADEVKLLKAKHKELKEELDDRMRRLNHINESIEEVESSHNQYKHQIKELNNQVERNQKMILEKSLKITSLVRKYDKDVTALQKTCKTQLKKLKADQKLYCLETESVMSELMTVQNEANSIDSVTNVFRDELKSLEESNKSLEMKLNEHDNISNLLDQLDEYTDVIEGLQASKNIRRNYCNES